jgi:hypothetical protein
MLRKRTLILAAAAGAAVAGTAVADTKSMHGASCGGTGVISEEGFSANNADDVVVCGLTRERNNSAKGVSAVHVELWNEAGGAGDGISCTLSTQREDLTNSATSVVYGSHTLTSSTAAGHVDVKPLKTATFNGNEGSYAVTCTLQTDDVLYHVYLNEPNSLD